MEVRHLQAFVAVADTLHFGRAAAELQLSPSPVSRTVAELERELGVRLFVRGHHEVTLTEGGIALLPRARLLLTELTAFVSHGTALAHPAGPPRSRIGSPTTAPSGAADLVTSALHEIHPELDTVVELGTSMQLIESLRRREIDVSVVHLPLDEPDLVVVPLARYFTGVVVTDDHDLADRDSVDARELRGLHVLTVGSPLQPHTMRQAFASLAAAGVVVDQIPDADFVRLAQLVRYGHGVTLSALVGPVAHVFRQPGLRLIPFRDPDLGVDLGVVLLRENEHAARLAPLVERLRSLTVTGPVLL